MRRPTLNEKRYGKGFREGPSLTVYVQTYHRCAVEGCGDKVYGTCELYVDDLPPALDWYTKILSKLQPQQWNVVPFCFGHLEDAMKRSVQAIEEPDLWAPGRENPPVLPRPPKLVGGRSGD